MGVLFDFGTKFSSEFSARTVLYVRHVARTIGRIYACEILISYKTPFFEMNLSMTVMTVELYSWGGGFFWCGF